MIIAITGAAQSGKTTLATWLKSRGYLALNGAEDLSTIPKGKVVLDGIADEAVARKVRKAGGMVIHVRRGAGKSPIKMGAGDIVVSNKSFSLLFDTTAAMLRIAA